MIETSPGNFQAWVRVSKEPIPERLATEVARELAREYAGDPASADWRHFGRLARFTNRKKVHQKQDGRFPSEVTATLVKVPAGLVSKISSAPPSPAPRRSRRER